MDTPASLPLAQLRALAAAEREAGEAKIRRADEIDAHIDALLSLVQPVQAARPPKTQFAMIGKGFTPPRAFDNSPAAQEETAQKSSRYGIVTGKWLRVLRVLAETAELEPFALAIASDAVTQEQGKGRRLAEIRRQFEPYIDAGYLVKVGEDQYKFTYKGFKKVGFVPGDTPVERAAEENEPSSATSVGADDGSETALAAQ